MDNKQITWTNAKRKLSDLIPWSRNPRRIKVEQIERLQESLTEFGQPETIAIGPGNEVYNGHQRLESWADKFGDIEVDVRISDRPLTEKEREKLTIFLHKGAAGEWDFDMLANEFDVDDLLDWGFDEHELDLDLWGIDEPDPDPGAQIDRAEELREQWGVETGQLWRLGEHRLICGDCTDAEVVARVMDGEKADMVFTDPPYGIGLDTDYTKNKYDIGRVSHKYSPVIGDDKQYDPSYILEIFTDIDEVFLWGANYYLGVNTGSWICWVRATTEEMKKQPGTQFELCWSKNKHQNLLCEIAWKGAAGHNKATDGDTKTHPTQKPVALAEWFLDRWSNEGEVIADFYLGSGTTLIACERLGRKCRAVEISPAYVAVAIDRWYQMTDIEPILLDGNVEADDKERKE